MPTVTISNQARRAKSNAEFFDLLGRKIWVVSCPRWDGADAFANTEATVDEILSNGIALKMTVGGTLIIPGHHIKDLTYIVL